MIALYKFIGVVATIVTACNFIDRITSDELKSNFADKVAGIQFPKEPLAKITRQFIESTIGRYFNGDFITWNNTKKSIKLSSLSILIVFFSYCAINKTDPITVASIYGKIDDFTNLVAVILLLICCFCTDVFSFLQTAMFMRLASRIGSLRDMAFMAACDLIVTVNLFVFVLPFFAGILIYYVDANGRYLTLTFEAGAPDAEPNEEAIRVLIAANSLEYRSLAIKASVNDNNGVPTYGGAKFSYILSKGIQPNDSLQVMLKHADMTAEEKSQSDGKNAARDEFQRWSREYIKRQTPDDKSTETTTKIVVSTTRMSKALFSISPFDSYSLLYAMSHSVQDEFLRIIKLAPVDFDLNRFMLRLDSSYLRFPIDKIDNYFVECDGKYGQLSP